MNAPSATSQELQQNSHACLVILDFSNLRSAVGHVYIVQTSSPLQFLVPLQKDCVGVDPDIMGGLIIVLSVDVVIGAKVTLKGCLALWVPAQHPQFRAASRSADAKRDGSPYNPPAVRRRAMPPTGAICALLDCTKQIMALMLAFCLALSMLGHRQERCRRKIVFAMMERTRLRRLKHATAAAVMRA